MGGWMDGLKAVLRIAHCNQKLAKAKKMINQVLELNGSGDPLNHLGQ